LVCKNNFIPVYDGQTESELETRLRNEQISERISTEEISSQTDINRRVWFAGKRKFGFTSQGLRPQTTKTAIWFQFASIAYNSSQISENTISSILPQIQK